MIPKKKYFAQSIHISDILFVEFNLLINNSLPMFCIFDGGLNESDNRGFAVFVKIGNFVSLHFVILWISCYFYGIFHNEFSMFRTVKNNLTSFRIVRIILT